VQHRLASRLERLGVLPHVEERLGHPDVPAGHRSLAADLRRRRVREFGVLGLGDLLEEEPEARVDELAEVEPRVRLVGDELPAPVGERDRGELRRRDLVREGIAIPASATVNLTDPAE
jgi:hypothetical protein